MLCLQLPFHLLYCPESMQTVSTCDFDLACVQDLDIVGMHAFDFLTDLIEPCEELDQPQALAPTLQDFDNNL